MYIECLDLALTRFSCHAAPMLDCLAAGLRECNSKAFVGPKLQLNGFLENMLTSRISRRVLAEQHINLHNKRCTPKFIQGASKASMLC